MYARMDVTDEDNFANWLGGKLPCTRIIYPSSNPVPPWLLDVPLTA